MQILESKLRIQLFLEEMNGVGSKYFKQQGKNQLDQEHLCISTDYISHYKDYKMPFSVNLQIYTMNQLRNRCAVADSMIPSLYLPSVCK